MILNQESLILRCLIFPLYVPSDSCILFAMIAYEIHFYILVNFVAIVCFDGSLFKIRFLNNVYI